MEALLESIRPLIRRSVTLKCRVVRVDGPRNAMKFGGLPYMAQGEEWPRCGNCSRSLTFVAQLCLDRLPMRLPNGDDFLVVFFCFECNPRDEHPWDDKAWLARTYAFSTLSACSDQPAPSDARLIAPNMVLRVESLSLPDWQLIPCLDPAIGEHSTALDTETPWGPYNAAVEELAGEQNIESRIGGYPHGPQGGSLMPGCDFVAQIDSMFMFDEPVGFGDCGVMLLFVGRNAPHRIRMRIESC